MAEARKTALSDIQSPRAGLQMQEKRQARANWREGQAGRVKPSSAGGARALPPVAEGGKGRQRLTE